MRSVRYGIETACFLAPKLWDTNPVDRKNMTTLSFYKGKLKLGS